MHAQSTEDLRKIARDAMANGMGKDEIVAVFRNAVEAEWQARTDETARKLYSREDWEYGEDAECLGHPAGPGDPMGQTVYCDGSCRS